MEADSVGAQLEDQYAKLIEALSAEQKAEAQQSVLAAADEIAAISTTFEAQHAVQEQELLSAVQEYECKQEALNLLDEQDGADVAALETAREQHAAALAAMERCLAQRAEASVAHAEAKAPALHRRAKAMRAALESFGGAVDATDSNGSATEHDTAKPVPSGEAAPSASDPEMHPATEAPVARYEPLQPGAHADLVIRVPASFKRMGISVDAGGQITAAPGGLFDADYTVIGVDGKQFYAGLDADGAHNVILRCTNALILQALERVPPKQLRGKALKLLQVQVTPGSGGFGIDLSEFNGVAGLVKGGAAEKSELRPGDVVVGADGVNTGAKKLVDVLQRGKKSHIFSVVRPATLSAGDKPDNLQPPPGGAAIARVANAEAAKPAAKEAPATTTGTAPPTPSAPVDDSDPQQSPMGDADLKRSLAESLGQLQTQTALMSAPTVQFVKVVPTDGTAITIEWVTRHPTGAGADPSSLSARYQLEWKLESETEWSHSEASCNLKSTVVTKGNLKPDCPYLFRVRARSRDTFESSGKWGPWSLPSMPVRPDGVETLSTIAEESSEVSALSRSQAGGERSQVGDAPSERLKMDVVQGLLLDQRQALTAEHEQATKALEEAHAEQLSDAQDDLEAMSEELADWKEKFAEAAGNSLQAVVDAKLATREEVYAEVKAQADEALEMRDKASKSIELIQAAKQAAAEAQATMQEYKARFDTAFAEAKAQTDAEGEQRLNVIMRNASLELRDKVRFVEQQTDTTVKRAVDEAVRLVEAKAEVQRRETKREAEEAADRKLEMMKAMVGASAKQKIDEVSEQLDGRVAAAVKTKLEEAAVEARRREEAAVAMAVKNAVAETEARLARKCATLEQQLVNAAKEAEARMAAMYSEEAVRVMLAKAKEANLKEKNLAVQEAVNIVNQRSTHRLDKMAEGLNEKVAQAVKERERQLLANDSKALKELAEMDLKEQSVLVVDAGRLAAARWGSGNDEFEEEALTRTRPAALIDATELLEAPTTSRPHSAAKEAAGDDDDLEEYGALSAAQVAQVRRAGSGAAALGSARRDGGRPKEGNSQTRVKAVKGPGGGGHGSDDESMVAPPVEFIQLKARHASELEALLSRQQADELMEKAGGDDNQSSASTQKQGNQRRAAEQEKLRKRQVAEAMAAGAALVQEERARLAKENGLRGLAPDAGMEGDDIGGGGGAGGIGDDGQDALTEVMMSSTTVDEQTRAQAKKDPNLKNALERVREMEERLQRREVKLQEERNAALLSKSADEIEALLRRSGKGAMAEEERRVLDDAMALLRGNQERDAAMQAMLAEVGEGGGDDAAAGETASSVRVSLSREEKVHTMLEQKLSKLLARDWTGTLSAANVAVLRELVAQLRRQQEQADMREAQIAWLKAETRRARVAQLLDAREQLGQLVQSEVVVAKQQLRLALPVPPIAAAEDAFSIAVDWVEPLGARAAHYHLQWRTDGEEQWTSSQASERIKVPCCTKGHLRTNMAYEFRVRAADATGRWGSWSAPTEPTAPSLMLNRAPSRPKVKEAPQGGKCLHVKWSKPDIGEKRLLGYEVHFRRCDGPWGEEGRVLECAKSSTVTPPLEVDTYYTFKVRALLERHRGVESLNEQTNFSPPSTPFMIRSADGGRGQRDEKQAEATLDALQVPLRAATADDGETVIAEQIRTLARASQATDAVKAAAGASLEQAITRKAEDAENLDVLEERHKKLMAKGREEQLNELVAIKQKLLAKQLAEGAAAPSAQEEAEGAEPSGTAELDWD